MSLSFVFGGSGAGKSNYIYEKIIKMSMENPKQQFLIIVPDQFTMQTQKELIQKHPMHGIMNIDVLSFGRLSHRIFEETGEVTEPVLDDTGKNLILRLVADRQKDKLAVLGNSIKRQGYIHEVKSAISEFKQYAISEQALQEMITTASSSGGKRALAAKLTDLAVLYKEFDAYIRGHYLTTEETLHVLAKRISDSKIIKDSYIAFDGFTGFTPIQMEVIGELFVHAKEVCFSIILDGKENPYAEKGEHELFALSRETVKSLQKLAQSRGISQNEDVVLASVPVQRLRNCKELAHLEQNLFRYPFTAYTEPVNRISVAKAGNPADETKYVARTIRTLLREGYQYRDIAVVCGSMESYQTSIKSEFSKLDIPFFIDQNRGILLNPFMEYIRSALQVFSKDFSEEAVMAYLRTGLVDIEPEEIDLLDNYVHEMGIRGYSKWKKMFVRPSKHTDDEEHLIKLNMLRENIIERLHALLNMGATASDKVRALYRFIEEGDIQKKLRDYELFFEEKRDFERAKEYHQIYPYIIDILSQIDTLLGPEVLTMKEFADLLDAGFGELQVGIIPKTVDHIVVGDMERTRLKEIKVLFFLGVNDGNIPKTGGSGGIISDIDREFLQQKYKLAPSPRQKMYTQRLYLYMNMTKPSERLYISYALTGNDGKPIRPAYLLDTLEKLYPNLTIRAIDEENEFDKLETWEDSYEYLADKLRLALDGTIVKRDKDGLVHILKAFDGNEEERQCMENLLSSACFRYENVFLPKELAWKLYGKNLVGSVTRLENFASCAYKHFLTYGLSLQEREEYGFEALDMGNVFHYVLSEFSERLSESSYTWFDFPEEFGEQLLMQIIEADTAAYGNSVLYENARSTYVITRMKRILRRTIFTLQKQIQGGVFEPKEFELSFQSVKNADAIDISLSEEEKIRLVGRIDRVDTYTDDNKCYVKVIDYKSGNQSFDIVAFYHGLKLQLLTYLNASMQYEKEQHPDKEVIPAGILYYHMDDPVVEGSEQTSIEEINEMIRKQLRVTGVVNDNPEIIEKLDNSTGETLQVLPLRRKKDGSFYKTDMLVSKDDLDLLSSFVTKKIKDLGRDVLSGNIEARPYRKKNESGCDYCVYKNVCGFDTAIPGYRTYDIEESSQEEILDKIRGEIG